MSIINIQLPVINGLSNISHPCQVLADIMAYNEKRGSIEQKSLYG